MYKYKSTIRQGHQDACIWPEEERRRGPPCPPEWLPTAGLISLLLIPSTGACHSTSSFRPIHPLGNPSTSHPEKHHCPTTGIVHSCLSLPFSHRAHTYPSRIALRGCQQLVIPSASERDAAAVSLALQARPGCQHRFGPRQRPLHLTVAARASAQGYRPQLVHPKHRQRVRRQDHPTSVSVRCCR